jgi:hypothetical protein
MCVITWGSGTSSVHEVTYAPTTISGFWARLRIVHVIPNTANRRKVKELFFIAIPFFTFANIRFLFHVFLVFIIFNKKSQSEITWAVISLIFFELGEPEMKRQIILEENLRDL